MRMAWLHKYGAIFKANAHQEGSSEWHWGKKPLLKQSYCTGECFCCHSLQVLIPGDSHILATSGTSAFRMSFAVSWQPPKKSVFLCTEAPAVTFCFFSGIIATPSPTLNLVFQRTSLRAGDPTAALILAAKFKPVSHFQKKQGSRLRIKKNFNVFYWFEAPREFSLRQSGLYLAFLLLLLFLFLQV